jgi:hypothetical protein
MDEEEIAVIRLALAQYAARRGAHDEEDHMERRKTAIAERLWHDLPLVQAGIFNGHD